MSLTQIIPLNGTAETFGIMLSNVSYGFTVMYRDDPCGMGGWFIDIADNQGNPLVQGIPLVAGVDLLAQYGYLNFGGELWIDTAQNHDATPTFTNLGTDCQLYWYVP